MKILAYIWNVFTFYYKVEFEGLWKACSNCDQYQ